MSYKRDRRPHRDPRELTARRRQLLDYIRAHIDRHGEAPTQRECADAMGVSSQTTIASHLLALRAAGYVQLGYGTQRGIRLVEQKT